MSRSPQVRRWPIPSPFLLGPARGRAAALPRAAFPHGRVSAPGAEPPPRAAGADPGALHRGRESRKGRRESRCLPRSQPHPCRSYLSPVLCEDSLSGASPASGAAPVGRTCAEATPVRAGNRQKFPRGGTCREGRSVSCWGDIERTLQETGSSCGTAILSARPGRPPPGSKVLKSSAACSHYRGTTDRALSSGLKAYSAACSLVDSKRQGNQKQSSQHIYPSCSPALPFPGTSIIVVSSRTQQEVSPCGALQDDAPVEVLFKKEVKQSQTTEFCKLPSRPVSSMGGLRTPVVSYMNLEASWL
ncbi:uncharacterized protein AAGF69_010486 [Amazona ochrocephala]